MRAAVSLYTRGLPPFIGVNLVAAAAFIFLVGRPDLERAPGAGPASVPASPDEALQPTGRGEHHG